MKTAEMRDIVLVKGDTSIGAITYPDRKRPAAIVQHGNSATVYGYFRDVKSARAFMTELSELVGAVKEDE